MFPALIGSLKDRLEQMQKLNADTKELEQIKKMIEDLELQKNRTEEMLDFFKKPDGVNGALESGDVAAKERLKEIADKLTQAGPEASIKLVMEMLDEDRAVVQGFGRRGTQIDAFGEALESIERFNLLITGRLSDRLDVRTWYKGKMVFGAGIDEQQENVSEMLTAIGINDLADELKGFERAVVEMYVLAGTREAMKKETGIDVIKAGRDFITKIIDPDSSGSLNGDVYSFGLRDAISKEKKMDELVEDTVNVVLIQEFEKERDYIINKCEGITKLELVEINPTIAELNERNKRLHILVRVFEKGQNEATMKILEGLLNETNKAMAKTAEKLGRDSEDVPIDRMINDSHIDSLREAAMEKDYELVEARFRDIYVFFQKIGVDLEPLHEALRKMQEIEGLRRASAENERTSREAKIISEVASDRPGRPTQNGPENPDNKSS